jgi:FkbM family methyltransferase
MILLDIQYQGEKHSLYYHNDLIFRIAKDSNTFFEEWLLTPLKAKVRSFDCVVDIGSNVGNHAYFFKNICNADQVLCFEPLPANIALLQQNCSNCEIHTVGLSSESKTGYIEMINSLEDNSGTARVGSGGIEILLKTLDSYNLENVTFIKVDVEGHELEVIKGASETINRNKPDLLIETHTGIGISDVMNLLPVGYSYEKIAHEFHYLIKYSS